jgi:hypothetical protein
VCLLKMSYLITAHVRFSNRPVEVKRFAQRGAGV